MTCHFKCARVWVSGDDNISTSKCPKSLLAFLSFLDHDAFTCYWVFYFSNPLLFSVLRSWTPRTNASEAMPPSQLHWYPWQRVRWSWCCWCLVRCEKNRQVSNFQFDFDIFDIWFLMKAGHDYDALPRCLPATTGRRKVLWCSLLLKWMLRCARRDSCTMASWSWSKALIALSGQGASTWLCGWVHWSHSQGL